LINKRIRYCDKKPINEVVSNALILGRKKYVEWLGSQIETNEYRAFIKADPVEKAKMQVARNHRRMESYAKRIETQGLVDKVLSGLDKTSIKIPKKSNDHG